MCCVVYGFVVNAAAAVAACSRHMRVTDLPCMGACMGHTATEPCVGHTAHTPMFQPLCCGATLLLLLGVLVLLIWPRWS